ncbi:hypothetical protein [Novosphingobium album (ex Hu et al. 2023)]|uniref:Secreted protein n=1 Tax=Novosphingobium album (ex Hu et al. 2023) TaxID=2930093 RepID=A0ABT0AWS2_9SPHN|nr:hypothetical protein [Novosphingobium album (ex Hu et al. 2023)]MCJ2177231.1 hypothetical protein [Novosphingobium album (ex Hu et al. 2023)]
MHIVSRILVSVAALTAFTAGAEPASETAQEEPRTNTAVVDGADAAKKADPIVCERIQQIGSLLRSKKVCMHKSEWDEQRRSDRANIERSQVQRGLQPAG